MKAIILPQMAIRFADRHCLLLRILFIIAFFTLITAPPALSQIPQGFTYQAVAFDDAGVPIRNADLPVRISIESDSLGGTLFWQELHSSVTTNATGFFSLIIGKGARQAGTAASFAEIDWSVLPKFIRIDIDHGGWKTMGASRLWSVPYAMAAGDLTGTLKKLEVAGEAAANDEALFEVKNKNGQTVFAVYNEGVRIYVGDGENKAVKGGFAIGSMEESKQEPADLFIVNRDSVRIYLYEDLLGKPVKGGFAIGSMEESKASNQEFMRVTRDSIRMYIAENKEGKPVKGGFAIGSMEESKNGDGSSKTLTSNYLSLTPDNYFIGHNSGQFLAGGLYNATIGYESGYNLISGSSNSFLGYQSGYMNRYGSGNLFLGYKTGHSNTDGNYNTFLGYLAGSSNTDGVLNSFMGSFSGFSNTIGSNNTFVGDSTGYSNLTGNNNAFIGTGTGLKNTGGSSNVFIGNKSGANNTSGTNNIFIGTLAGYNHTNGEENIYIGNNSGFGTVSTWGNVFVGFEAGKNTYDGSANTFLGASTGFSNKTGFSNTFLGINAGYMFDGDFGNVFIGDNTGYNAFKSHKNVLIGAFSGFNHNLSEEDSFSNVFIGNGAGYNSVAGNENVFIGFEAGFSNVLSYANVFMGNHSGFNNKTGNSNVFVGNETGFENTSGFHNVFLGNLSGKNNTTGFENVFIGNVSGESNTTAVGNTFIGTYSGGNNTTGEMNVFVGIHAGQNNTEGTANTIVGGWAAADKILGDNNTIIGAGAGRYSEGTGNVFLGLDAGFNNSGNYNLFLGNFAGANEPGSHKLYIENSDRDSTGALIWGDFDKRLLRLNAGVGIGGNPIDFANLSVNSGDGCGVFAIKGTASHNFAQIKLMAQEELKVQYWEINHALFNDFSVKYHDGNGVDWRDYLNIRPDGNVIIGMDAAEPVMLDVNGNARFRGVPSGGGINTLFINAEGELRHSSSDVRLKTDIVPVSNALSSVMGLRGVSYRWIESSEQSQHLGFIAQEVEKVLPELVFINPVDGYKGINYSEMTAVLVEAIKEQQAVIERQQAEIEALKAKQSDAGQMKLITDEVASLKQELTLLKALIVNENKTP